MSSEPSEAPPALDWRPSSYWDHADPVSAIVGQVKGNVRREIIRQELEDSPGDDALDPLLPDDLSEAERAEWGRLHPDHAGGEYLPQYGMGEVEIARVICRTTLGDTLSLRARRSSDGRLHYRVVDDIELGEHSYALTPASSSAPLSLGEVVELLWTLRMSLDEGRQFIPATLNWAVENADEPEAYADHFVFESVFYSGLHTLLVARVRQCLGDLLRERGLRE